ncbi:c-type cytochrome [Acetobacter sp. LMG 1627]|uniref:C-type cytochrome n=2 Tax=Acetobacter conturbans TaxID=1737472 RepID=A0ABX0K1Z6_9PROT|nr:cytochrome c [Acetobacter conturbans]NHN88723.1 c-type cytochrome [Acetobacter conturbans]
MRKTVILPVLGCLFLFGATPAMADSAGVFEGAPKGEDLSNGQAIYRHVCQSCHMADGRGAQGAGAKIPALADNSHLQSPYYPASIILHGYGAMQWFTDMLDDQQVADVVNYIRTHFGNHYTDLLKPQDVAPIRPVITQEEE